MPAKRMGANETLTINDDHHHRGGVRRVRPTAHLGRNGRRGSTVSPAVELKLEPMSVLTLEDLVIHQYHRLGIAVWGDDPIVNMALVCEYCQEVLADWDQGL